MYLNNLFFFFLKIYKGSIFTLDFTFIVLLLVLFAFFSICLRFLLHPFSLTREILLIITKCFKILPSILLYSFYSVLNILFILLT